MAGGLVAFGRRYRREVAGEMRASSSRVHEHGAALTPVKTGRMRSLLREQPTDGGLGYFVGWVKVDFTEEGQTFYAPPVVLGYRRTLADGTELHVPANDPITPALEADRNELLRGLRAAAFRAARAA